MRLILVSNRLPITVQKKKEETTFKKSVGGLATGVSAFLQAKGRSHLSFSESLWIGWPGVSVKEESRKSFKRKLAKETKTIPVFLPEKLQDRFYNGFCNRTIWPLFHYFPTFAKLNEEDWKAYEKANEFFAKAVFDLLEEKDVLWIHDYHLMLLPKLIREKRPNATIGFFLHIPFPSFEIFRFLPTKWRRNILEGLLGADLIGFHTYDYTHAFLRCSLRILGLEHHVGQIQTSDRVIKVDSFPMGIDFEKFQHEAHQPKVIAQRKKIKKDLEPFKVIFSVDRLDYTKGILNRLQGFDLFLENFPKYRKKVVLMLVVVPSRTPVEQYRQMKRQIDEYIGRINGKYASLDWTPILYQYRSFDFSTLVALYSLSDIALITPLRDGMNLIAKEYLASRIDRHGSLILSEMAGAARELGEAILINPNYKEEIAEAIKIALEMPLTEQSHRLQVLQNRLKTYDVVRWGEDYFNELREIKEEQKKYITKLITPSDQSQMLTAYRKAKKRILFLDYDGTLIPFSSTPDMATPPRHLIQLLKRLTLDSRNQIVLISGRNRKLLEEWLRGMPIDLIAEHGAWIKIKNKPWKLLESVPIDWKPKIIDILKTFADRLPGAFVEEKDFSVVWHFRKADPELAKLRQRELLDDLVNFTASSDIQVVPGNKIVEIRTAGIHKGNAALEFLNKRSFDFIFAIGDDQTDEDLFSVLPPKAYSFRVGIKQTLARFNLSLQAQAIELIQRMGK